MDNPEYIFDGDCDNYGMHNTAECNFDGGDCVGFNEIYPNCTAPYESLLGDGYCLTLTNTPECGYDGGDCTAFNKFPNCSVDYPYLVGNDFCDHLIQGKYHNTEECGFDGGDCDDHNEIYPDCDVDYPPWISNNRCNGGPYNIQH